MKKKVDWSVVNNLSNYSSDCRTKFYNLYPKTYRGKDIRLTFFSRISNVCDVVKMNLVMIQEVYHKQIDKKKYRVKIFRDSDLSLTSKDNLIADSKSSLKRGLYIDVFQTTESAIRLLCKGAGLDYLDTFYKCYKNLLDTSGIIPMNKTEYKNLLLLMSTVRNSIHNNGIFNQKNNRNLNIKYKGETYNFVVGHLISLKWSFIFIILEGVIEMYDEIQSDLTLKSKLSTHIKDPTM